MHEVAIPPFVKAMGYHIIGYLLNLDDDGAQAVLDGAGVLDARQHEVLQTYVQLCVEARRHSAAESDVDFHFYAALSRLFIDHRHAFNVLREQAGAPPVHLQHGDAVVRLAATLALEVYPLFLLEAGVPKYRHLIGVGVYGLPTHQALLDAIRDDGLLRKMFSHIGDELETVGSFRTSSGVGGGFQLATLPSMIITNALVLLKITDRLSPHQLVAAIAEIVRTMRLAAQGETVLVPMFVGFHNVGFEGRQTLRTECGNHTSRLI